MEFVDQSNLIDELLEQQDTVIEQLDQLIERIEVALKTAGCSVGESTAGEKAASAQGPATAGSELAAA